VCVSLTARVTQDDIMRALYGSVRLEERQLWKFLQATRQPAHAIQIRKKLCAVTWLPCHFYLDDICDRLLLFFCGCPRLEKLECANILAFEFSSARYGFQLPVWTPTFSGSLRTLRFRFKPIGPSGAQVTMMLRFLRAMPALQSLCISVQTTTVSDEEFRVACAGVTLPNVKEFMAHGTRKQIAALFRVRRPFN
jgi:hypothetical protein